VPFTLVHAGKYGTEDIQVLYIHTDNTETKHNQETENTTEQH